MKFRYLLPVLFLLPGVASAANTFVVPSPAYGDTMTAVGSNPLSVTSYSSDGPTAYELYAVFSGQTVTEGMNGTCGVGWWANPTGSLTTLNNEFVQNSGTGFTSSNSTNVPSDPPPYTQAWQCAGTYKVYFVDVNDPGFIGQVTYGDTVGTNGIVAEFGPFVLTNDPTPTTAMQGSIITLPSATSSLAAAGAAATPLGQALLPIGLIVAGLFIGGSVLAWVYTNLKKSTKRALGTERWYVWHGSNYMHTGGRFKRGRSGSRTIKRSRL